MRLEQFASAQAHVGTPRVLSRHKPTGESLRWRRRARKSWRRLTHGALDHLQRSLFNATGVSVKFQHMWSCEKNLDKCEGINSNWPVTIYTDVMELSLPEGATEYGAGRRSVPAQLESLFAGTSCKDASQMNAHQAERRDCVAEATSTTGGTFNGPSAKQSRSKQKKQ